MVIATQNSTTNEVVTQKLMHSSCCCASFNKPIIPRWQKIKNRHGQAQWISVPGLGLYKVTYLESPSPMAPTCVLFRCYCSDVVLPCHARSALHILQLAVFFEGFNIKYSHTFDDLGHMLFSVVSLTSVFARFSTELLTVVFASAISQLFPPGKGDGVVTWAAQGTALAGLLPPPEMLPLHMQHIIT